MTPVAAVAAADPEPGFNMLFHRSFITLIWRIISGDSLPIGHSTLDTLLKIDQTILKEAGYNLVMATLHNDVKISLVCKLCSECVLE